MPRVKRRQHRRRTTLTQHHLTELLTGYSFVLGEGFGLWYLGRRGGDELEIAEVREQMRHTWGEVRDELLPAWIVENPGRRPWAWWEFDTSEPRRCVSGPGAYCIRHPDAMDGNCLWFGRPTVWMVDDFKNPSTYETQGEYLDRLGLFVPGERKRWQRAVRELDPQYEYDDGHSNEARDTLALVNARLEAK